MLSKRYLTGFLLFILLSFAFFLRSRNLGAVWTVDLHSWGGATYSVIARNYMSYGFIELKGAPLLNGGLVSEEEHKYYFHHPPLLYWTLAFSFQLFGISEMTARSTMIVFSLATILVIYFLGKRLKGRDMGLWAAWLGTIMPIAAYYGAHVDVQGAMGYFFIYLMFLSYLIYLRAERALWLLFVAFVIAGCVDWSVYYTIPFILLHYYVIEKKRGLTLLSLPILASVLIGVFLSYTYFVTGVWGGPHVEYTDFVSYHCLNLFDSFKIRALESDYSVAQWLSKVLQDQWKLYTPAFIGLGCLWFVLGLARGNDEARRFQFGFILLMLVATLSQILLFQNIAWHHEYWSVNGFPALALAGGSVIVSSSKFLERKRISSGVKRALGVVFVIAMTVYSTNVVLNLYEKRTDDGWYRLGIFIKEHSEPSDRVYLNKPVGHWFTEYYAEREIIDNCQTQEIFSKKLRDGKLGKFFFYRVTTPEERPTTMILYQHLKARYKGEQVGDWIIFNIPAGEEVMMDRVFQ